MLLSAISVPCALLVSGAWSAPTEPASVVPPLESDVPGTDKSPVPTAKEWQDAARVKLSRTSAAGASCAATRVREWLRVRCPIKTFAISLLGGSNESLSFWIGPEREGQFGEVQFPLRRGDRRVLQLWTQRAGADGTLVPEPSIVIQEQWVEGEPAPTVTVL
jgi:hypothetical protein